MVNCKELTGKNILIGSISGIEKIKISDVSSNGMYIKLEPLNIGGNNVWKKCSDLNLLDVLKE